MDGGGGTSSPSSGRPGSVPRLLLPMQMAPMMTFPGSSVLSQLLFLFAVAFMCVRAWETGWSDGGVIVVMFYFGLWGHFNL